jgi:hypothetical protein
MIPGFATTGRRCIHENSVSIINRNIPITIEGRLGEKMKRIVIMFGMAGMLTACVHDEVEYQDASGRVITEPAGAAVTNEVDEWDEWYEPPRDINQRPYGRQWEEEGRTIDPYP